MLSKYDTFSFNLYLSTVFLHLSTVQFVTYVGRNSTVSTGHQKNQRLSKTPPPHPAPKARIFFWSQNKEMWWERF